ncbi:hypothetical protein EJ04DRAFT_564075 [Polyplosphaeria fusca]|uniref:Uncharacterized protein n=1 Tax=Polyplosphaeria fusca TaxID=682080 RepID=A0A9P4QVH3_9PLEO|nr:hypothetical protein EJ04DRAFT_564075 [Polyplosphaeria fusca]
MSDFRPYPYDFSGSRVNENAGDEYSTAIQAGDDQDVGQSYMGGFDATRPNGDGEKSGNPSYQDHFARHQEYLHQVRHDPRYTQYYGQVEEQPYQQLHVEQPYMHVARMNLEPTEYDTDQTMRATPLQAGEQTNYISPTGARTVVQAPPGANSMVENNALSGVSVEPENGDPFFPASYNSSSDSDSEDDVPLRQRMANNPAARANRSDHEEYPIEHGQNDIFDNESLSGNDDNGVDVSSNEKEGEPSMKIDWKLPEYEAIYECEEWGVNKDIPTAKVSLPGMPRETLYLSPDHPLDEFAMIRDIFLATQKERSDTDPKLALLNFHTIAVLVLDYLAPANMPQDFDTEDAFLTILDKWRIGKEAKRETYMIIRGVQEFFDVALDMVYYIKQHGFVPEPTRQRKERSDKGVKRGPRADATVLEPRKKIKEDKVGGHAKGKTAAAGKKNKAGSNAQAGNTGTTGAKKRGRPSKADSMAAGKSRK